MIFCAQLCSHSFNSSIQHALAVKLLEKKLSVDLVHPGFKQVKGNTLSLARTVLTLVISDEQRRRARAILDTGATIPLITKQLSNTLRVTRVPNSATVIQGLSGHCYSPYKVNLTLKSLYSEEFLTVKAHVVDEIPVIPSHINMQDLCSKPFLKDLQLADPDYKPGSKIDILLGFQQCNHSSKHGISLSSDKDWKAEETIFGWAVGGVSEEKDLLATATCLRAEEMTEPADQLFQKFWASQELPGENADYTPEELQAVAWFKENHSRTEEGRYVVTLPRKYPTPQLGRSRAVALKRYLANECSLKKQGNWEAFDTVACAKLTDLRNDWDSEIHQL